ncbi:MAG: hypothetical protein WA981_09315 [Glaciecola sp.]
MIINGPNTMIDKEGGACSTVTQSSTCIAGHWRFDAKNASMSVDETLSTGLGLRPPIDHQSGFSTISLATFIASLKPQSQESLSAFFNYKNASKNDDNKNDDNNTVQTFNCFSVQSDNVYDIVMLKLHATNEHYCSGILARWLRQSHNMQTNHSKTAIRHAINSPLHTLQGALQMLKQMPLEPDAIDALEIACKSYDQINETVQELIGE